MIGGEREAAHKEPHAVVVSPDTEGYENRGSESSGRFVGEGKVLNLERPMELVEDPTLAPHTASNYQSKVTDPTGAGKMDYYLLIKLQYSLGHSYFLINNRPRRNRHHPSSKIFRQNERPG